MLVSYISLKTNHKLVVVWSNGCIRMALTQQNNDELISNNMRVTAVMHTWDPEAQALLWEDVSRTCPWACPETKTFRSLWWACLNDSWWRYSTVMRREYLLQRTSKQSHSLPAPDLRVTVILFFSFFFSIWLNGYLMNCFSGTDRQSTTCSKIANSVVASSTLLGDIGSSSSSEMRGFNLGLSYPKEAMWNINAFY